MSKNDLYSQAHLIVSAIRILTHQNPAPPSVEQVCKCLNMTVEQAGIVLRRLEKVGAVKTVEGAFGARLAIKDHLAIEEIPKQESESRLDQELKKFKDQRKNIEKKIDAIKADHDKKQKDLFAELEKKIKKGLDRP